MILSTLLAMSMVGAPTLVETKVTAASLFKNGYAVVVREAPIPESGVALIDQPPLASLGTLWVTASSGVTIDSVVATKVKSEVTTDLNSLDELITANKGKSLTLWMVQPGDSKLTPFAGKIVSASGSLLVLDLEDGTRRALLKSRVVEVTSAGGEMVYQAKSETSRNVLRVTARGRGTVMTISLERGLTWVPGYHVDITDEKKLKVTSKATIMNDSSPLRNVDLKLITGFPHVRFIGVFDPLTSAQSIDQFIQQMMGYGANAAAPSAMTQNAMFGGARLQEAQDANIFAPFDPGQLEGMQLEDLFFYSLKNVTLENAERGYYVLFQEQADYEHIYTLDVPETGWWQNANENYRQPQPQPQPTLYDVWHTLEFTNPSAFPLTTAAATTFKSGQIIGQDMLSYTAPKGKAKLRITKALDLTNDVVEEETERQIRALPSTNRSIAYDLVTAKGTIEVVNYKAETVKMKVTKQLVGEVLTVSNEGTVVKNRIGLRTLNPNSSISWTVSLKAGEKLELTYTFKVYVPSP
jgi:hypothetical protein